MDTCILQVSDTGEEIALTWPDGHVSIFTSSWLKSRSFQKDAIEKRLKKYGTPQKLWGSELEIPRHDFEEVNDVFFNYAFG